MSGTGVNLLTPNLKAKVLEDLNIKNIDGILSIFSDRAPLKGLSTSDDFEGFIRPELYTTSYNHYRILLPNLPDLNYNKVTEGLSEDEKYDKVRAYEECIRLAHTYYVASLVVSFDLNDANHRDAERLFMEAINGGYKELKSLRLFHDIEKACEVVDEMGMLLQIAAEFFGARSESREKAIRNQKRKAEEKAEEEEKRKKQKQEKQEKEEKKEKKEKKKKVPLALQKNKPKRRLATSPVLEEECEFL